MARKKNCSAMGICVMPYHGRPDSPPARTFSRPGSGRPGRRAAIFGASGPAPQNPDNIEDSRRSNFGTPRGRATRHNDWLHITRLSTVACPERRTPPTPGVRRKSRLSYRHRLSVAAASELRAAVVAGDPTEPVVLDVTHREAYRTGALPDHGALVAIADRPAGRDTLALTT